MSARPDSVNNHTTDSVSLGPEAAERLQPALRLLFAVHVRAQATGRDPWDIALGLPELEVAGLTHDDLRELTARGLLAHQVEEPGRGGRRTFVRPSGSALSPRSHFLLTAAGAHWAEQVLASDQSGTSATPGKGDPQPRPEWDAGRRLLSYSGRLVKRVPRQATNQLRILDTFRDDGWEPRIDNPIPGDAGGQRMRQTLNKLIRDQLWPALWFEADGDGVCWWPLKQWRQMHRRRRRR